MKKIVLLTLSCIFFFIFTCNNLFAVNHTIIRDNYGVPHIYSDTLYGLFFGLGYANAQDRLYQLEMFKRAFKGRLSEVLGSAPWLFPDQMFLTAGYTQQEFQAFYDVLDEEYKTVITAFTDGINQYISEALSDRANKLPYEFEIYGFDPEAWIPTDVLVFSAQIMKRPLGGKEITCAGLLDSLIVQHGEEIGHQIFDDLVFIEDPSAPTSVPTIVGSSLLTIKNKKSLRKANSIPPPNIQQIARSIIEKTKRFKEDGFLSETFPWGVPPWEHSMGLAIGPSRSTTGNPIFLGGPQIDHAIPSGFYEAGLHGPGIDAVGNMLVGIPAIAFGHNSSISFTFTAGSSGNSEDFFVETLNPNNPNQYWYNSQWEDMNIRTEFIPVKDSTPVEYQIRSTVHGPVIEMFSDSDFAYTVKWVNREIPQNTFVALYDAMKATNVSEFQTAVNKFALPYNFLYADNQGNIGYFHVGNFPIRSPLVDDRLPTPGTGEYEWQGFMADEDKPFSINPSQGYLVNWNNKPKVGWLQGDYVLNAPWGVDSRVYRFNELMATKAQFSLEDLKNISFEISMKDLNAPQFKSFLLGAESTQITDPRITTAKQYLEAWDNFRVDEDSDGKYDSPAVEIWDAWWRIVIKNTFEDEFGVYYAYVSRKSSQNVYRYGAPLFLRALLGNLASLPPSRDYFGGLKDETLLLSLVEAIDNLETKFGTTDMSQWKGTTKKYSFIPSYSDIPTSSSNTIIIPFMERGTQEHLVELTQSFPTGINVVPPGASGFINLNQSASPHFADQVDLYLNWEYKNMNFELDSDGDGISDIDDNCPEISNGLDLGTCTSGSIGDPCTIPGDNESECGTDGFCSMNQEDTYPPSGNGIGDVCDCEADFTCDGDIDGTDAATFKTDFGRSTFNNPCTTGNTCNGDFDCDGDADGTDAAKFKEDFGRSQFNNPCPACMVGEWCMYQ